MKFPPKLLWICALFTPLMAAPAPAAVLTGSLGSHDPSRMIFCNGKYYIYSTGGGVKSSTDRINWTQGTSPFAAFPSSRPPTMRAAITSDQGIWAPDVIFHNGKYLLYYSVASSDGLRCATGLVTSPTLDPAVAGYKWTDAGVVILTNDKVEKKSGIDPAPFLDASGNLWLAWGSGYANGAGWGDPTVFLSRMDNNTGLRSAADLTYYPTALGHIEAGYVHYRNGYYYLFWNDGGCCSGASSTYKIHLARSASLTGPYVDKNGSSTSNVTFMSTSTSAQMYGPGHIGILSEPGIDRFTFHYYPATGGSLIGQRSIVWGADGWPSVGADLAPGTYRITSAGTGQAISVRAASATDGVPLEMAAYAGGNFQRWTVSQSTSTGTTLDGYYRIASVGSGKVMDLSQASAADGTLINQWTLGTGNNQRWLIERNTDGTYRIESRASRDVLALPTSGQLPLFQVTPVNGGSDRQISFPSQSGWNYTLQNSTNLRAWTTLATLAGTGGPVTYTHAGAGAFPQSFWRANVQQALNGWTWDNLPTQKWNFAAP